MSECGTPFGRQQSPSETSWNASIGHLAQTISLILAQRLSAWGLWGSRWRDGEIKDDTWRQTMLEKCSQIWITWFILRHCRDPPTGGSVCKMSGIVCVKNSEAIRSGWDRNDLHEPTLGAGASAPYKRTFLTPRENITSSNWSTSPVMSQRLQQRSAFQCMLQDFISRSDFMRSVVCVASKCLFWRYLFKVEPAEFCSLNKFPANITGEQQEKEFNNSLLSHRSRSLLLLSCRWRRPPCSTGVSFMNFTFHKPSSVHHRKFFCRRK